jgi:ABC-2 type transport system permease protein
MPRTCCNAPLARLLSRSRYRWSNAPGTTRISTGAGFFIPGVIGTLTLVVVVGLTASAIVREREMGTLEQIMVTPIRPIEFILGKTVPFFLIGLAEIGLIALFGAIWFRVPFVGNPLVLLFGASLFLLNVLGLGLLISTVCKTQQQAFASNFLVLNPMFILSGFAFPIASMPQVLQWLTYLNPLRYFLIVIRAVFLKGVGLEVLWPEMLAMAVLGAALIGASVLRFRKSLD